VRKDFQFLDGLNEREKMYPPQHRDIRKMDKPVVRFLPARENTLEIEIETVIVIVIVQDLHVQEAERGVLSDEEAESRDQRVQSISTATYLEAQAEVLVETAQLHEVRRASVIEAGAEIEIGIRREILDVLVMRRSLVVGAGLGAAAGDGIEVEIGRGLRTEIGVGARMLDARGGIEVVVETGIEREDGREVGAVRELKGLREREAEVGEVGESLGGNKDLGKSHLLLAFVAGWLLALEEPLYDYVTIFKDRTTASRCLGYGMAATCVYSRGNNHNIRTYPLTLARLNGLSDF
jgi:hypothetical protein